MRHIKHTVDMGRSGQTKWKWFTTRSQTDELGIFLFGIAIDNNDFRTSLKISKPIFIRNSVDFIFNLFQLNSNS